jgi:hypothetical protein
MAVQKQSGEDAHVPGRILFPKTIGVPSKTRKSSGNQQTPDLEKSLSKHDFESGWESKTAHNATRDSRGAGKIFRFFL